MANEIALVSWRIDRIERSFRTRAGFDAAVARGPFSLLGYVDIHDHPILRELDEETQNALEVHGGVTFNDEHEYYTDPPRHLIGFDCAHGFDIVGFGGKPKDAVYVEEELEKLAEQLREIEIRLKATE